MDRSDRNIYTSRGGQGWGEKGRAPLYQLYRLVSISTRALSNLYSMYLLSAVLHPESHLLCS